MEGPPVAPGRFKAVLTVNGQRFAQTFDVVNDPRSTVPAHDIAEVVDVQKRYVAGAKEALDGYRQVDLCLSKINAVIAGKPPKEVTDAANALVAKIQPLKGVPVNRRRAYGPPNPDSFGNLNIYLILQMDVFSYGDGPLTDHIARTYGNDWTKLKKISDTWREAKKDMAKFNAVLLKNGLPQLAIPSDLQEPAPPAAKYLPPVEKPVPAATIKKP